MPKPEFRRVVTALLISALLIVSLSALVSAAAEGAPLAQGLSAEAVEGTIPGGQFAKIWLGLEAKTVGENITLLGEWDRVDPESHGLGFYVLNEGGLARVLNGAADVREANLSASNKMSPEMPANQLGAQFRAMGGAYTIVVFNDSNSDANFSLSATNGIITDDSDQVRDPSATATPETTETGDDAAEDDASAEATETATEEPAAVETPVPVATVTEVVTGTDVMTTTEQVQVTITESGVVSGLKLSGELPNQNDQHFLKLEPSEKDGTVSLLFSFEPQDSTELARRMNFWVLDQDGFNRFVDPSDNSNLASIAFAAGSSDPQIASYERKANFTSSGFGPYTVIVYNNSRVPGTYTLRVDGGLLTDDSGQTLNATATTVVTGTAATGTGEEGTTTASDTASTSSGREGEPGGSYTIQSGDTLSLIARDVYGDLGLWDEICAFNDLGDCNKIEVGDVVRLPTQAEIGSGAVAPAATPAPAAAATPVAAATPETSTPETTTPVTTTTTVTSTDTMTSTGEVEETATTTSTTGTSTEETSGTTIDLVATLEESGNFDTLVEALTTAGLVDALKGNGPFTIHAPTDAAFAALPSGAMDQLLANPTGQLTQILLFHILPGKVMASDISNGMQATTQQGKPVTFEVEGDEIRVNGAAIVAPDLGASNGVVHAIDAVILPPPD